MEKKFNLFVPDGTEEKAAVARTTHMCIAAHQDDIELMAYQGIAACFGIKDEWFFGVVVTDGASSPRDGLYANYTATQMIEVRALEQKKAAVIGEYGALALLNYTSEQTKAGESVQALAELLRAAKPKILYTHNLADKHETHLAVVGSVLSAVRSLPKKDRPKKLYGCEVWRGLDWVSDNEKVTFDVSAHPSISAALVGVFDSQICGGKRYDLAAAGRRAANATYGESHGVDALTAAQYAIDLTPLIEDDSIDPIEYICAYIRRFEDGVKGALSKFIK